jgi:hypothetical protein
MSHRYKVRVFESGDQDGSVGAGTIVLPLDRNFSLFARSAQEAEAKVQSEVATQALAAGCIYQVCPPFGNPESIRSFAVDSAGNVQRVYLDPASGIFSEFRRLRYQDLRVNKQREEVAELQQVIC